MIKQYYGIIKTFKVLVIVTNTLNNIIKQYYGIIKTFKVLVIA